MKRFFEWTPKIQYGFIITIGMLLGLLARLYIVESFIVRDRTYEPRFLTGDLIIAIQVNSWTQNIFGPYVTNEWLIARRAPLRDQWALRKITKIIDEKSIEAIGESSDRTIVLNRDITHRKILLIFSWDASKKRPRWERILSRP